MLRPVTGRLSEHLISFPIYIFSISAMMEEVETIRSRNQFQSSTNRRIQLTNSTRNNRTQISLHLRQKQLHRIKINRILIRRIQRQKQRSTTNRPKQLNHLRILMRKKSVSNNDIARTKRRKQTISNPRIVNV